jgi:hypothetical protein
MTRFSAMSALPQKRTSLSVIAMSVLYHKRTLQLINSMSAFPPKADIAAQQTPPSDQGIGVTYMFLAGTPFIREFAMSQAEEVSPWLIWKAAS